MKKITLCLCALLLCGCTTNKEKTDTTTQTKQTENTNVLATQYYSPTFGCSTTSGYYRIALHEEDGNSLHHIMYLDYKTKEEVYLCDKPECYHQNESCTAYLADGFTAHLFCYGDSLYILHAGEGNRNSLNGNASTTTNQANYPAIERRDLDGNNSKQIMQLKDGYDLKTQFAIIDQTLYIPGSKNMSVTQGNATQTFTTNQKLYAIELDTGSYSTIADINFQSLIGAYDHNLVFQTTNFHVDMEQLLKDKNYEAYDNAFYDSYSTYTIFDIDQESYSSPLSINDTLGAVNDKNLLYVINDAHELVKADIVTREQQVLAQLDPSLDISINQIEDGLVLLDAYETIDKNSDVANNFQFVGSYVYDGSQLREFALKMKDPAQPVMVFGEYEDSYFVLYDHDGTIEDTWAGTKQYQTTHSDWGIIKKSDFWNGISAFTSVHTDWVF